MHYPEIVTKARALIPADQEPARRQAVRALMDNENYPAMLSLVLELEEDMTHSVSQYSRTADERAMDAGGLATIRRLKAVLDSIATPEEKEPEPPPAPGLKKR